jgi:hypothetical protein
MTTTETLLKILDAYIDNVLNKATESEDKESAIQTFETLIQMLIFVYMEEFEG